MNDLESIWEAERESYRIQFIDEILPIVKDMTEEYFIVSTHPENKAISDINFCIELENRLRNTVK